MSNKKTFSLKSRLQSFVYAADGIITFLRTEHNSWLHLAAAILVIIPGKMMNINNHEWCMLALAIGFVFTAEIFNTAIELLTDIVSPGYSEKAKRVKDLAAGGVLIAAITSVIIALNIFIPKL